MDASPAAAALPALVLAAGWRVLAPAERVRGGLLAAAGAAVWAWSAAGGGTVPRVAAAGVVLVALAALGHVILRGPPGGGRGALSTLGEGLVSSLAAVAACGARLRAAPDDARARASDALVALAALTVPIAAAALVVSPRAGAAALVPLGAAAATAALLAARTRGGARTAGVPAAGARGVAFDPVLALSVAVALAVAAALAARACDAGSGPAALVTVLAGVVPGADGVAAGEAWHRDALGAVGASAALAGAYGLAVGLRLVVAGAAGGRGLLRRLAPPAAAAVLAAWAGVALLAVLA